MSSFFSTKVFGTAFLYLESSFLIFCQENIGTKPIYNAGRIDYLCVM